MYPESSAFCSRPVGVQKNGMHPRKDHTTRTSQRRMPPRQEALSRAHLEALSQDPTKVVYEPTYDTVFEPWPAPRVRAAVTKIARIASRCADAEQARSRCQQDEEIRSFASLYQKMYERLSDPSVARNSEHVHVIMEMIRIHDEMRRGLVSEERAKTAVSDIALASLMRQTDEAPKAPKPPQSVIEELD